MQKSEKWKSSDEKTKEEQSELEKVQNIAFQKVCTVIEKSVIEENEIMKLSDLQEIYIDSLESSNHPNNQYRGEKLKNKLEKHPTISSKISFLKLEKSKQFESYLILNSSITVQQALSNAYEIGRKDKLKEIALDLRYSIFKGF